MARRHTAQGVQQWEPRVVNQLMEFEYRVCPPNPRPGWCLAGLESSLELTVQRSVATVHSVESTVGPDGAESAAGAIDAIARNLRARSPLQKVQQGSRACLSNTEALSGVLSAKRTQYTRTARRWRVVVLQQHSHTLSAR